jgi:hypothetical protein
MCERWDFRRGFSIDWSRHKIDLKITRKDRGLFAKRPYLQPPDRNTDRSFSRTGTCPGASNPRSSEQLGAWVRCKMERGDQGDRKGVLTCDWDEGRRPEIGGQRRRLASSPARAGQRCWLPAAGAASAQAGRRPRAGARGSALPFIGARARTPRPMAAAPWPCRPWPSRPDGLGRAGWPQGRGAERVQAGRAHGLGPNR